MKAVKLASPFPPVPDALMDRMAPGSTGAALRLRFVYKLDPAPQPSTTTWERTPPDARIDHMCKLTSELASASGVRGGERLIYENCMAVNSRKAIPGTPAP